MSVSIQLCNLSVHYGKFMAVNHVSLTVAGGALTAITGPNGSGKSSLIKAIAGILPPSGGHIHFQPGPRPAMAYLPQATQMQRDFPITVEDVVLTGFYPRLGEWGKIGRDHRAAARHALDRVGLDGLGRTPINQLSGGQFQRTLLARVMIQNAPVILLDEPFTAIDAETTARMVELLQDWHTQGRTVVCVLHDPVLIETYFPTTILLRNGSLDHVTA